MRKEAAAKFTSRCSTCGVTIHPGETITYDPAVKYSSRHKACPVAQNPKPKVAKGALLNGPVIAQPQSSRLSDEHAAEILAGLVSQFIRPLPACKPTLGLGYKISVEGKWLSVGTSGEWVGIATDFHPAEGEAQEYVVSLIDGTILEHAEWRKTKGIDWWTRELGAPVKREAGGKNSVHVGDIEHTKTAWYIIISVDKPYYMSAEDAEDCDMFDRGGGWATPYEMREISEPPAEREKREATQAAKVAALTAKKQAGLERTAKFAELTAGLFRCSMDREFVEQSKEIPLDWREGENYESLIKAISKVTGATCYVHPHGGYDDYRLDLYADGPTRDAITAAWAARCNVTPAEAREWLAKYSKCVGSENYAWVVEHADLR